MSSRSKQLYGVLLKFDGKIFFLMHNDGNGVMAFHTEKEAVDYFVVPYKRAMRGYEQAMSACIHNIFFEPVVIPITQTLINRLITRKLYELSCLAGWAQGAATKPEARKFYKKGKQIVLNVEGICAACQPDRHVALTWEDEDE